MRRIDNDWDPRDSYEMRHPIRHASMDESISATPDDDWVRTLHTARRTRSIHRNGAIQNTVNFLPSRRINHFGTVRGLDMNVENMSFLDHESQHTSNNQQVDEIVNQFEQNDNLMEDTPDGEVLRIEAVRDIPQCLTMKRSIKAKLSASVSKKSNRRPIGFFKRMKYRFSFWQKRMKQNIKNILFSMELWYNKIKIIEGHFGTGVATYFIFLRWLLIMNLCSSITLISFVVIPQALHESYNNATITTPFSFWDIFTGQGSFTNTTLFYGFYSSDVLNIIPGQYYNIPFSYFFTMLVLYAVIFFILSISMARSYRTNFIKTSGSLKHVYANMIFSGWDFSIATTEAATLKSKSFYNTIKELLNDSYKVKSKRGFGESCYLFFIQLFLHIFVLVLLGLTGLVMWSLMDDNVDIIADVVNPIRISSNKSIIMAVIITVIMFAFPILFSYIIRFEKYQNPRTILYITLFRTFLLEVVVVSILGIFWLRSKNACWETSLGQEVYRLIIFDTLFSIILLPISEYLRSIIYKYVWADIGMPEFDIARNTLGLIYNQTLLWMGLFFSPILGIVMTLKMALQFYIKYFTIFRNCQPSSKSWRASQTRTLFLFLIFVSLLCISLMLLYTIIRIPTGGCGPFKNEEFMYIVILDKILNIKENNTFFAIIMFFTKPGVVAFILIAMSVGVYYLHAKSIAKKLMVSELRKMLVLQSKDKEFLLKAIQNVYEGRWVYNQNSDKLLETTNLNNSDMRKPSNVEFQFSPKYSSHNDTSFSNAERNSFGEGTSYTPHRRNYENVEINHP